MRRRLMLADRVNAGRLLGERLAASGLVAPLVLGLPRGGVPVAAEIAKALQAPLDVVFVRKIGAPAQPELAIGAAAAGGDPEVVLNDQLVGTLDLSESYIANAIAHELAAMEQRRHEYQGLRPGISPADRTVIVVDDGVATGMTMQAALRQLKRSKPARLIVAAPVASREAVAMLKLEADEVVYLASPRSFSSVSSFYRNFGQVSDAEVMILLREAAREVN